MENAPARDSKTGLLDSVARTHAHTASAAASVARLDLKSLARQLVQPASQPAPGPSAAAPRARAGQAPRSANSQTRQTLASFYDQHPQHRLNDPNASQLHTKKKGSSEHGPPAPRPANQTLKLSHTIRTMRSHVPYDCTINQESKCRRAPASKRKRSK